MRTTCSFLIGTLALAGCTTTPADVPVQAPTGVAAMVDGGTRVLDEAAAGRLLSAKGVTLQWIGWNQRGSVNARRAGDTILLTASQSQPDGPGRLFLDGRVTEIGSDYFVFDGVVRISDSPDVGRQCELDKSWRFAITQERPYWRLREFEWCDGLTDYVDIYF